MKTAVVILAAGQGKRMNSSLPKVLHKIFNKHMIQYVIDSVSMLKPFKITVVAGKHFKEIKNSINSEKIFFALQKQPKGTADALLSAKEPLKGFKGTVLVVNGDTPLITPQILGKFLELHSKKDKHISFISFKPDNPAGYGRVIRDYSENVSGIIEEKDASDEEKKINEVNSGVYAIESEALELLRKIPINLKKKEYYLTDIIRIGLDHGYNVGAFCIGSEEEMSGINTRIELASAQKMLRKRFNSKWMEKSVEFIDPDLAFISPEAVIGAGTRIYPNVHIEGKTKIGKGCVICPNVRIIDSAINDNAVIKDSTIIESSTIKSKAVVGPFAHIRPGSEIGSGAKIGNFVEIKKSKIGDKTKASHLSYIGDASTGKSVNIGAGTITCNYDGMNKHKTTIEDNVFVGSDTQLVAPVKIGKGAYIGAGSTITKDVPPMSLAVSRTEQRHIKNWASKKNKKVR
ncbi:MAG: bifunctional UDP-N-acetylglucosamine diphosphorylase/glucosamine-1-phosphate N-acetyltransferase GlmU [Nitrospiraceae bacterium]|nr:bifunctional UDP-N-acetylglucosamine diphosphorylase/glucosamine-1-phosphate N-acetyltransferase GlmU [Nitrospiraceae bacterium]